MALNPLYVTGPELEDFFIDKDTGLPLAGGLVYFWEDASRTTPKLVYEISGSPPNYTYSALPNPIVLSSVGTFQDDTGNNIAVYYYPWDTSTPPVLQLYYISVYNSFGVEQFTREAWPYNLAIASGGSTLNGQYNISNMLTNPGFAEVLFIPANGDVISFSGAGSLSVAIAPGWTINITYTGTGTVTIAQNSITGSSSYPGNPPYSLTITPGANISGLTLSQQLTSNPGIWSDTSGTNGYVATSMLLAPMSSASIAYAPSTGTITQLLSGTNGLGTYQEFNATVELPASNNTSNSNVGYSTIVITLPVGAATTLSNIQVCGLESNISGIVYEQTPVNRQIDQMFNYYFPLLAYKPIPSCLTGWDFPTNPAQFLTSSGGPFATGANTSNYVWDQTIIFQNTNSGFTFARGSSTIGSTGLQISMVENSSIAIIQYLDQAQTRELLIGGTGRLSVNVSATTSSSSLVSTISLWICTGNSLPNMGANASLVATLSSTGKPATLNGTWVEIPRSNLGDATFSLAPLANNVPSFGFNGWDFPTTAIPLTAHFFAIVVGIVNPVSSTEGVIFDSISLVPGDIPTVPAPQTPDEVLRECQRYYRSSFPIGTAPATEVGANTGCLNFPATTTTTGNQFSQTVFYGSQMRVSPSITFYNPVHNNAQAYDVTVTGDCSMTASFNNNANGFCVSCNGNASTAIGDALQVHYSADARLGIV